MEYAADRENGARAETLLRDDVEEREVSLADVRRLDLARLGLRCALSLGDLAEPAPGMVLERLLREGPAAYPALRDLAATAHPCGAGGGEGGSRKGRFGRAVSSVSRA